MATSVTHLIPIAIFVTLTRTVFISARFYAWLILFHSLLTKDINTSLSTSMVTLMLEM